MLWEVLHGPSLPFAAQGIVRLWESALAGPSRRTAPSFREKRVELPTARGIVRFQRRGCSSLWSAGVVLERMGKMAMERREEMPMEVGGLGTL